ncbi:MAG TPA: lysogenization regulator HflD [Gammaproteobacteria bacterium]|nr:lysogenization regulator HflD [Gammaproteobacteria bacterium]
MSSISERTLALAGMFQAAALVKAVATTSEIDQQHIETTMETLFVTSPQSTLDVYGSIDNLYIGLHTLIQQLGGEDQRDIDIARYVISLLHLCNKLIKNGNMMAQLSRGIENARSQREHFPLLHENVIANLAGIYADTVSQLQPKIMVTGDSQRLSNNSTANMVRALLLAGMRSAVLWRQLKGSRWQVLLQRKRFVQEAEYLLKAKIIRH